MSIRDWSHERVVIIGAARQGIALADYLLRHGAWVVLNDLRGPAELENARQTLEHHASTGRLEWVLGDHPIRALDGATLVCPSGGVPLNLPLIEEARGRGIALSNDSQIFLEAAPCKVIGITGSAGKTTTTTLVGRMAVAAVEKGSPGSIYRQAWVGGNIGSPLITVVDNMRFDDLAVMELSSFQLEIMRRSPQVAAVLNITPNHLDRHQTMEAYTAAKARILEYQKPGDFAVLGRDDAGAWSLSEKARGKMLSFGLSELKRSQAGSLLREGIIYLRLGAEKSGLNPASELNEEKPEIPVMSRDEILLRGEHNLLNVMAACTIAAAAGLSVSAMKAGVQNFMGVPHRLEFIRSWGGADWYNDSIATAPERAIAAIRSFEEPLVLLAGGRDKNLPWGDFLNLVRERVDHLILFGESGEMILKALAPSENERFSVVKCQKLHEAVQAAAKVVERGDVVLLSPGGTSFDEFNDFEERGECFARWVRELQ